MSDNENHFLSFRTCFGIFFKQNEVLCTNEMKSSHHGSGRVFLFLLLDLFHKNNLFASLSLSLTIVFVISGSLALLDYTLHKSAGVHVILSFLLGKKRKNNGYKNVINLK